MVDVEIDGAMATNAQCQQWCGTAAHSSAFLEVGCCQFISATSTCTAFATAPAADGTWLTLTGFFWFRVPPAI